MKSNWQRAAGLLALALGLFLAGSATAEITYNYLDLDYVNIDVDVTESVVDSELTGSVDTDSDAGFRVAGSWQFYENWHMFGDYSIGENDIDISGTFEDSSVGVSGSFDVTRWRVGIGYGYPVNPDLSLYGRLSYDGIEFDEFDIAGINDIATTDDSGIGAETGVRWLAADPFELQGYVRYTSVGEIDVNEDDSFERDVLFGVTARYFFNDTIGAQAGYEIGEIDTWNLSARLRF